MILRVFRGVPIEIDGAKMPKIPLFKKFWALSVGQTVRLAAPKWSGEEELLNRKGK